MSKRKSVSFDTVRQLALALPGVEEGLSYGIPTRTDELLAELGASLQATSERSEL